jgi:kynurenine--oxoglutarate transaminase/cysteine-S-conjugate beta-lyase/glutamine--phenylpyruvate transaminase
LVQDIADAISPFPRAVVLSDEVYKFIVHSPPALPPGAPAETVPGHTHFASRPGMYERTLTISSAGKTFSATGWQVGWAIGPESLIAPIQEMLPSVQFCASTLMQEAIAKALPLADEEYEDPASGKKYVSYYAWLLREYTEKRDFLVRALEGAGFRVPDYSKVAGGGFFIFAQVTDEITSEIPADVLGRECAAAPGGRAGEGWALCEYLLESKGVGLIPASPFFSTQSAANEQFVRVAFCKNRKVIEEAGRALLCTSGGGEEGEEEDSQCQALLESASLT